MMRDFFFWGDAKDGKGTHKQKQEMSKQNICVKYVVY